VPVGACNPAALPLDLPRSLKHNRAFVSRDNNIGVFRANLDDGAMEFVHTISNVVDAKGNRLVPSKVSCLTHTTQLVACVNV
jgi:hypothetical protein